MGNTSGNCQLREGVLNSAPCSVLISRGRGRGAPGSVQEVCGSFWRWTNPSTPWQPHDCSER
jgi:hypothetical protein